MNTHMTRLFVTWQNLMDERGATAVEYGIIVALIAAVVIGIITTLGVQVKDAFSNVSAQLPAAS